MRNCRNCVTRWCWQNNGRHLEYGFILISYPPLRLSGSAVESLFSQYKYATRGKLDVVNYTYGGPQGCAMHQYLSDNVYAPIDNIYVMVNDNYAMIDDNYATMMM